MPQAPIPRSTPPTTAGVPPSRVADAKSFGQGASGVTAASAHHWDAWMITLEGEIDAAAVTGLQQQVTDALTGYDRVVVDLHGVSVLGTSALALLCCALRRAHRPGATIVVAGAAPAARRALGLCDLPGVELHPRPTARWAAPDASGSSSRAHPEPQHAAA